jgi:hypothetical protein
MKNFVAALGISTFILGAVGCATDDGTPDIDELPPAVVAQLDPNLEVLVINPKAMHDEGRVELGDASGSRIGGADDSFNRGMATVGDYDRASLPDDQRQPAAVGDEGKVKVDPADFWGSSESTVGNLPPATRQPKDDPFNRTTSAPASNLPPASRQPTNDPFARPAPATASRVNEWGEVADRFATATQSSGTSFNGGANQEAPSTASASSNTPPAELDPCSCEGDKCLEDWVDQNVGCDVCVVFTCGDNYYPHSCHTCQ